MSYLHSAQRNHIDVPLIVLLTNVLILSPCLQAGCHNMLLSHLRSTLANSMPINIAALVVTAVVLQAVLDFTQFLKALCILTAIFVLCRPAMVTFPRRRVQHDRYNLRGNPPRAPVVLQQTDRQRTKDLHTARISRGWPIRRATKMSRGLANRRNDCFRNSALQALMHAPKFLNWALSHNVPLPNNRYQFPCQGHFATEKAIEKKAAMKDYIREAGYTRLQACPACAMKRIVEVYWGNQNMGTNGKPNHLTSETQGFRDLVRIDVVLMRF